MSSTYQPPDKITIPAPMPMIRQRGKHATGETYGRNIKVRVSIQERRDIEEVATALDMNIASFIRWCATRVASQLIDDVKEHHEK